MSKIVSLDYYDHDYHLIGIHTSLEDFRLAFFLNAALGIHLKRSSEDLDFHTDHSKYALYLHDCQQTFIFWSLIANKCKISSENEMQLFTLHTQTAVLIKEQKQIDYFLKIEGEMNVKEMDVVLSKINNIKNIITSYSMNPQTLKSKDFLIF